MCLALGFLADAYSISYVDLRDLGDLTDLFEDADITLAVEAFLISLFLD